MTEPISSSTESQLPKKADVILSIGKALSERRKLRNLSIEKVNEATKIRPHIILALEEGRWDDLPGEVYVRGFVTRYAQYLGLQPHELLNPYLEVTHQQDVVRRPTDSEPTSLDPSKAPWVLGGAGVLVLIGLIRFIGVNMSKKPVSPVIEEKSVAVVESTSTVQDVAPPIIHSAPVPSVAIIKKHTLRLFSPNEVWIRATSSSRTFEGTIPAGSTWTFTGEGKVNLKLGHSRDIMLIHNDVVVSVAQKRIFEFDEN